MISLPTVFAGAYCPATMCPMFAREGSLITQSVNHPCEGTACGWGATGRCVAPETAFEGVAEAGVTRTPKPAPP